MSRRVDRSGRKSREVPAEKSDVAARLMTAPPSDRNVLATAKGGILLAAGSFSEFASRFVIALLLANFLGAEHYGLYVLSISAATIFMGISALGLDDAMVRYVAILFGRSDRVGIWGTLQIGLGVSALAGGVMGGVLLFGARSIAEDLFNEPRLTPLLHLFAVVVPVLTVSNVLAGIARGFGRMDYAALAKNAVQPVVRMVLLAALAVTGRLDLFAAAVIFGISDVAAIITLMLLLNKQVPLYESLRPYVRRDFKDIFVFALPLWLSGLLRQFRRQIELVMLGALSAASSAGVFAVINKVNLVAHVFLLSIIVAVKPILARLHDRRDQEELAHLYVTATRWTLTLNVPFFLVMVLYAEPLLLVFGKTFASGATALVILAFAELVNAGTGICGPMIDMTGHTKVKLANSVLWTILLISGGALLIPRWGVVGAATAALVAISTVNLLCVLEVWFLERLTPFNRTFWKPVAAGVVALIVGLMLRQWMPVGSDWEPAVLQAATTSTVYAGMLLLLGLAPEDRAVLDRLIKRIGMVIRRVRVVTGTATGRLG